MYEAKESSVATNGATFDPRPCRRGDRGASPGSITISAISRRPAGLIPLTRRKPINILTINRMME